MDFLLSIILKLSLALIAIGGVFIGHKYFKMKNDNVVEQIVEQHLEDHLGIDIDLSPEEVPSKSSNYRHRSYEANENDSDESEFNIHCITQKQLIEMEEAVEKKIEELNRIENDQLLDK